MKYPIFALFLAASTLLHTPISAATPERPKAGKVELMKLSEVKPGMTGIAWTVFNGTEPEPVPVEILGFMKNQGGTKQDIILGRMDGKAIKTGVAAGMSGSPVYVDGKLIGAVALRFGAFAKDPICGITPIEYMLEINDLDSSRPSEAKTPELSPKKPVSTMPGMPQATPIETPLVFSGFEARAVEQFQPMLQQLGVSPVFGGGGGATTGSTPVKDWQSSLQPGASIAAVLASGDMNIVATGTVSYNDGKRVLAFGHPFFNLGPVNMPMAKSEVVLVLPDQFQPFKMANSGDIVGALRQDRHSGIMGVLGETAEMIPVSLKIRTMGENGALRKERELKYNVFIQQKWTPFLMMLTLFNALSQTNEYSEEATYRMSGNVGLNGQPDIALTTMLTTNEAPVPAPMQLASWWGDKFNRLFLNNVNMPKLTKVDAVVDLIPERRVATIENAYVAANEVQAGEEVPVKVYLRPYRGERIEREFKLKIPATTPKGELRVLLSDADTLNRMQAMAGAANRFLDLPQTVSLINQERTNNRLYVSLIQARPTVFYEDKTLPSLPASALNVIQAGRTANRPIVSSQESAQEQSSLPFEFVVNGSYGLRVMVN